MTRLDLTRADLIAFSNRLKQAASEHEPPLSIRDVSIRCGVTYETSRRWHNGIAAPEGEGMAKLAAAVGRTPGWLRYGDAEVLIMDDNGGDAKTMRNIPTVQFSKLHGYLTMDGSDSNQVGDDYDLGPSGVPVGEQAFRFVMGNDTMEPTIRKGWICTCDRLETPVHDDIVVAIEGDGVLVRRLVNDGSDWWLQADNAQYSPRKIEDRGIIKGVVLFVGLEVRARR